MSVLLLLGPIFIQPADAPPVPRMIPPDAYYAKRPPVEAPMPRGFVQTDYVDFIVINRERQLREWEEENHLGVLVKKREFRETWWISFWDVKVVAAPPFGVLFAGIVDRGWISPHDFHSIAQDSAGFSLEKKGGKQIIIGRKLFVIDSPYDWEVKHRFLYDPIKQK